MIVRIIHVHVTEDSVGAFKKATVANHEASLQEPGVLRFDVLQDAEDPAHFILSEAYVSEQATQDHKTTRHYAVWKEAVEPMMAKARAGYGCSPVAPVDEAAWRSAT